MSVKSTIEWTNSTWNPVTGCTKVSPGCAHCYAERLALRLQAMGKPTYRNGFDLATHQDRLEEPLRWKKPQMIFVNSMSDLFHEDLQLDFIRRVFDTMRRASWHHFQVLTKRSERVAELAGKIDWPENVWLGVSVETQKYFFRIEHLRTVPAKVRFLSLEPLLGALPNLPLDGIHWVIVGGESGPGARPMRESWVLEIKSQCLSAGVPFFFKQWGGVNKKDSGRKLRGHVWDQLPRYFEESKRVGTAQTEIAFREPSLR